MNTKEISKIVVHGGAAHLDEFVACSLAFVAKTWTTQDATVEDILVPIERRDPTPGELADPCVLVLDVGREFNPRLGNFDHHQLERGNRSCAMTLLASELCFDDCSSIRDFMARMYPWFDTRAVVDSCGPFTAAKEEGIEWKTVARFLGPFEDLVLGMFTEAGPWERAQLCARLSKDILAKADAFDKVSPVVEHTTIANIPVIDFLKADPDAVKAVSDAFVAGRSGVAVFHDDRGDGYTLLRLNDDPRVDFSRVKDDPAVLFAHANGFICKTRAKDPVAARDLIEKAVVQ